MIIGLSGRIGSGKSTVSNYLVKKYGFQEMSFAESLKDTLANIFNWDREMLEGSSFESRIWREEVDHWWSERLGMTITPRKMMQQFGTDLIRNQFHQDIWIASLENKIHTLQGDIVVSDCRFPNEIQAIRNLSGMIFRITKDENDVIASDILKNSNSNSKHISEWAWVNEPYDYEITNDGSIIELHNHIDMIINKL